MKNSGKSSGFTLVEIAIGLVIIGLLIGGIIKAQELILTSQVNKTTAMVKAVSASIETFRNKYGHYPGDMPRAIQRVTGCADYCLDGDGDSFVGQRVTSAPISQAGTMSRPSVETTMFWKHMVAADLISGVAISAPVTSPAFGITHPATPIGGGLVVTHFVRRGAGDTTDGLSLVLQGLVNVSGPSSAAMTPRVARMIDLKMDDGHPNRGYIAADYDSSNCDNGGVYQVDGDGRCILYFSIAQ